LPDAANGKQNRQAEKWWLLLKTKRRQGLVVGSAGSCAGAEEIGVREQIHRHESAVAVASHADTVGVNVSPLVQSVCQCCGIRTRKHQESRFEHLKSGHFERFSLLATEFAPMNQILGPSSCCL
jgi:hypothetical protein